MIVEQSVLHAHQRRKSVDLMFELEPCVNLDISGICVHLAIVSV